MEQPWRACNSNSHEDGWSQIQTHCSTGERCRRASRLHDHLRYDALLGRATLLDKSAAKQNESKHYCTDSMAAHLQRRRTELTWPHAEAKQPYAWPAV